jgi:hypothetical protein
MSASLTRRLLRPLLIGLLAAFITTSFPVGIGKAAVAESRDQVVGLHKFCRQFLVAESGASCSSGHATADGALKKYSMSFKKHSSEYAMVRSTILSGDDTTCSDLSITVWGKNGGEFTPTTITLLVRTTDGTKRITTYNSHSKTLHAALPGGPFLVRLSVHDYEHLSHPAYMSGSARCTTDTGA